MSARLRILYVIQGILPNTGPGRHLFKLLAYRNHETVDAQVFAFDECDPAMMEALELEHGVRSTVIGKRFTSLSAYIEGCPKLFRQIRDFRPHVIQTHHTPIVDWIARAATFWCRVPVNLARAVSQPRDYHLSRRGHFAWWFTKIGDAATSSIVDYYLPNSADVGQYLAAVEGVPIGKIVTIVNGIDVAHFATSASLRKDSRDQLGLHADDLLVVTIGILKHHKGQRYLVEAASNLMVEFPNLRVALAGAPMSAEDQAYLKGLQKVTEQLGVAERFHFLGIQRDVRPVLAAADVYVHPSLHEGSSNAVLEAMAMSCACIVTDVTGCPELVEEGHAGVIVPQRDTVALAGALRALLLNAEMRRTLGSRARKRAVETYDVRRMSSECEDVARRALREKGVNPLSPI